MNFITKLCISVHFKANQQMKCSACRKKQANRNCCSKSCLRCCLNSDCKAHVKHINDNEPPKSKRKFDSTLVEVVEDFIPDIYVTFSFNRLTKQNLNWKEAFSALWKTPVPKEFSNLSLKELLARKDRPVEFEDFLSCVPNVLVAAPVLVATPADVVAAVVAAVGPAVAAAVGPAVVAAVGPAVTATFNLLQVNIRMSKRNEHAFSGTAHAPQPLYPLLKTNVGVGPGLPNGPPAPPPGFVAAVAIGASPGNFPATTQALDNLTPAQLNGLAIMYNDDFGVLAGDNVTVTRNKFQSWVGQN
jgi:hypothetical protein